MSTKMIMNQDSMFYILVPVALRCPTILCGQFAVPLLR